MEWFKIITDFLIATQWSIVGLIVLFVLKKQLCDLMSKPFSFDMEKKKLQFNQPTQEQSSHDIFPEKSKELSQLMEEIKKTETDTSAFFEKEIITINEKFNDGADKKLAVLIKVMAIMRTNFDFEFIYNRIYGSQIELLRYLFSHPLSAEANMIFYYDGAAKLFPDLYKAYGFEQWIKFLSSFNLIEIVNNMYSITAKGKDFVNYINERNYAVKLF